MDAYIIILKNMTYRELKNELMNNNDPKKDNIIRTIMLDKAKRYIQIKKSENTKDNKGDIYNIVDSILDDIERDEKMYPKPKKRKKEQFVRDKLNDAMAERLQSELYINNLRKKRDKRKEFIHPFINTSSSYQNK